jgi:hypothetical protein
MKTTAFRTRDGKIQPFAAEFAQRLLFLTGRCRDDMHEPDEQGFKHVQLVGDHLDNAMGDFVDAKMIRECFQEYVLFLGHESGAGYDSYRDGFNLATLIAFARIGAIVVRGEVESETAWNEPQIPGDSVREIRMKKGSEIGDVRIQDYTATSKQKPCYRVASFLPGRHVCMEGDTPKTEPEHSIWVMTTKEEANDHFAQFVEAAKADGWVQV